MRILQNSQILSYLYLNQVESFWGKGDVGKSEMDRFIYLGFECLTLKSLGFNSYAFNLANAELALLPLYSPDF